MFNIFDKVMIVDNNTSYNLFYLNFLLLVITIILRSVPTGWCGGLRIPTFETRI